MMSRDEDPSYTDLMPDDKASGTQYRRSRIDGSSSVDWSRRRHMYDDLLARE